MSPNAVCCGSHYSKESSSHIRIWLNTWEFLGIGREWRTILRFYEAVIKIIKRLVCCFLKWYCSWSWLLPKIYHWLSKNSEIKHFSHWDQKPSQYFYLEIISSYALACPLTLNWLWKSLMPVTTGFEAFSHTAHTGLESPQSW